MNYGLSCDVTSVETKTSPVDKYVDAARQSNYSWVDWMRIFQESEIHYSRLRSIIIQEMVFAVLVKKQSSFNWFNSFLREARDLKQALAEIQTAKAIWCLYFEKNYDIAFDIALESVKINPESQEAHIICIESYKKLVKKIAQEKSNFSNPISLQEKEKLLIDLVNESRGYSYDTFDLSVRDFRNLAMEGTEKTAILSLILNYQKKLRSDSMKEMVNDRVNISENCAKFARKMLQNGLSCDHMLRQAYIFANFGLKSNPFNINCYDIKASVHKMRLNLADELIARQRKGLILYTFQRMKKLIFHSK